MTVASQLALLSATKSGIKAAIEAKGVTVGTVAFSEYPAKVAAIGSAPYVRPTDWLALPVIGATEQKFCGLFAVFAHGSNYVAFTALGNYTVDWGDGTVTNYASGVKAEHLYLYAGLPAGSVSSRGYKQAVVTLTPQAGASLTYLNFNQLHSALSTSSKAGTPWLDMSISGPSLSALLMCSDSPVTGKPLLEKLTIGATSVASYASMLVSCVRLREVSIGANSALVSTNSMFQDCNALESAPLFDTSNVTDMAWTFYNCRNLKTVPLYDTAKVVNMSYMFRSCSLLSEVPTLNTSQVVNMSYMFQGCSVLKTVPLMDTSKVTTLLGTFADCFSLTTIPLLNTANVTTFSTTFRACASLVSVPLLSWAKVTNADGAFTLCNALEALPDFVSPSTSNLNGFLTGFLQGLQELPAIDFLSTSIPISNTAVPSLGRSRLKNVKITHSYAYCSMQAAALEEVYTNLATVTGQTITVTGNPGAAASNKSIATAKGWTVIP